jgi:PAS domain S-box
LSNEYQQQTSHRTRHDYAQEKYFISSTEIVGMADHFVDAVETHAIFKMDSGGKVSRWNAGAEQIKGYSENEILDRHYRTFFTEEAVNQGTPERLLTRAENKGMVTGRGWRVHKDGSRFWVDFTLTALFDDSGELCGFTKVLQDVTAQREYQQQLERQNERLEEFVSEVSHDLKTPLNIAEGRLELAREECDNENLDDAATAVERSVTLIDNLLSHARDEAASTAMASINLAETAKWCWRIIETTDQTLVIDTERTIRAVPTQLKQILNNLLANALEHGGQGVTVTVGDLEDGFYIADSGSGIPKDEYDQVFEKGHSSDSGTGLGLHIVEENVEELGVGGQSDRKCNWWGPVRNHRGRGS